MSVAVSRTQRSEPAGMEEVVEWGEKNTNIFSPGLSESVSHSGSALPSVCVTWKVNTGPSSSKRRISWSLLPRSITMGSRGVGATGG